MSSRVHDPNHRRETYHSPPIAALNSQERRRQVALEAQKQRRIHAIEAARSASSRDLVDMEDLSLAGSSDSDSESPPADTSIAHTVDGAEAPPVLSRTKRKAFKPRYKAWAKNLLSFAETLDLRHSLPDELERDWRAVIVPRGKRCLCATTTDAAGKNTILYSRVAGRTLGRFHSVLPPDCLLDTVWDPALSVLWVLDVCKWRSTYTVECEADFRAFFITSKISELPMQPFIPPPPDASSSLLSSRPLLVLPAPSVAAPLTPSTLLPVLTSLSSPSSMPVTVLTLPDPSTSSPVPVQTTLDVPLQPSGLLLYLSAAHYESGLTPLVTWVPCEVEPGMEASEGVGRFRELLEQWERRGEEAKSEMEEVAQIEQVVEMAQG
ncbi:hypothetical protein JCM21900_006623 [Sporobolomyces salmonicolor]